MTVPTLDTETALWSSGAHCLLAFDEVGRGSGCGPANVALVCLHPDCGPPPTGLADSKALTARRREQLIAPLRTWVSDYAIGEAEAWEVDEYGIVPALRLAATRALTELTDRGHTPQAAIIDGDLDLLAGVLPQDCTRVLRPKADRDCASVAAASVLAKVYRDQLMSYMALRFPEYGLDRHFGYPTPAHKQAVRENGLTSEHRRTWTW